VTKTDRILLALADLPEGDTISVEAVAAAIDESDNEKNIGALLYNLKHRGLVAGEPGLFALTDLGRQRMADSPPGSDEEPAPMNKAAVRRAVAAMPPTRKTPRANPKAPAREIAPPVRSPSEQDGVQLAISDEGEVLIIEDLQVIYAMPADLARRVAQLIQRVSA
jgi:pyruvate/2-oxoglutarate dehydrogenase complex dihydrolipoamide acyltransferase (E2) component